MWGPLAFDQGGTQRGAAAVDAYVERIETSFLFVLEYEEVGFRCDDGHLPPYESLQDAIIRWRLSSVYVVETSYDWTFVVTSEQADYGGPFFATYDAMDLAEQGRSD